MPAERAQHRAGDVEPLISALEYTGNSLYTSNIDRSVQSPDELPIKIV